MKKNIKMGFIFSIVILLVACKNSEESNRKKTVEIERTIQKDQPKKPETDPKYADGKAIYTQYCISCHQSNGSGVPNLNPPLKQTEYVLGDKQKLIGIILNGSSEGLEVKGNTYSNNMPAFDYLKDEEIAEVLSYIRNDFGNNAEDVTAEDVQKARDEK